MSQTELKNKLSKHLFWDIDTDSLDVEQHAQLLVQRVLERGEMSDWRFILDYYGLPRIVQECKQMRSLDPVCLSYICLISDTRKEDYRCYHFKQSNPTLWNS